MADAQFGEARQADLDSGAGTDLVEVSGLAVAASGGALVIGGFLETGAASIGVLGVGGGTAHDAVDSGLPLKVGGYASAAAPTGVSGDGDRVNAWFLRNGAQATVLTAAGALVGGDAANGLDVDVTRLPALVAGSANIGDVDVLTVPADPFGANADAASATGSISAKLRFIAGTGIPVTGTVAVTLAAAAGAIAKAEDVASADADVGVPSMAVRKATPANTSGLDGDYEFLQISAGRLWASATIDAALPAGTNAIGKLAANSGVDIGDVDVLTLPNVTLAAGTNTNEVVGDAAHDAAAAGNPVLVGAYASAAAPAGVSADADAVRLWALRNGSLVVNLASGGTLVTVGQGTMAASLPVTIASNQSALAVSGTFWQVTQPVSIAATVVTRPDQATTAALSNVASSASSVTLLASNANRLGASIFNDSTQVLYVKFGSAASATSFVVKMAAADYYEVPFAYSGIITGIWASANGSARVTEVTA